MQRIIAARALLPMLVLLLLFPSQTQAANRLPWMTAGTGAQFSVIIRNTPNMPEVAVTRWAVLKVDASNITIQEDGLLGVIGALGVSLISSGTVSLLQAHVVLSTVYNVTSRLCLRPCTLLSPREHAWEWIPSSNTSSLIGQDFDIFSTTFEVTGNTTLAPYNRTAWQLQPLIQVYLPSLLLYNFWYDQSTGVLLRADLFSSGNGNLTITLANSTSNIGAQNLAAPLTPAQLSITFLLIVGSYVLLSPKGRMRIGKSRLARLRIT